jgi:hypothetical protein
MSVDQISLITQTYFRILTFMLPCFRMSCVIFWVVHRRMVFNSRRFGTLCLFNLRRPVKMEQCSETSVIKQHTPAKNPKITHDI